MIELGTYTLNYAYRRGSATPPQLNNITLTASVEDLDAWGAVVYQFRTGSNPLMGKVLFGYADSTPTFPITGKYDGVSTGTSPATVTGLGYNPVSFTEAYSINSVSATYDSPLSITTKYNEVFGTNKSNAEVYAELQRLYGEHECFVYGASGGSGVMPFVGANSYNFNFYQSAADTEIPIARVTNFAGNEYPTGWDSSFTGGDIEIEEDYLTAIGADTLRLAAYLIFWQEPPEDKLRFNVYVDGVIGEKGPSININWVNLNEAETFLSDILIVPHIWIEGNTDLSYPPGPPLLEYDITTDENEVVIPLVSETSPIKIENKYNWNTGEFSSGYVALADRITANLSSFEKILTYGIDGIPNSIRFFLRFDYTGALHGEPVNEWGDLWYVDIPYKYEGAVYITPHKIDNSIYQEGPAYYDTEVIVIGGLPPEEPEDDPDETEQGYDDDDDVSGDGPYPDPDDQPDVSDYDSEGFPGTAILTKTYKLTAARLQDVGTKLWSASYFNVLKVQSNPIENIIACRWYPMDITGGSDEGIVIGDVSIGTNGSPIETTYRKVIGSYTYKGVVSANGTNYSPGYLAQSPYTIVKLHLPYVGTVQLDASEIYNRQLHIEYIVDIITGDVLVLLKLGSHKLPYMSLSGKMGVDIPLSGTDRAQVQIANATRAMTAAIGAAGHMISGDMAGGLGAAASGALSMAGMDYSTQRVIQHSSVCASYDNRAIVIEMQVNKTYVSAGFKKYHGLPSHQYIKLSKGMGFIQLSKRAIIDVAMTDEENRMLESIMVRGCYF